MWPDWNASHVALRRPTWRDAAPFVFVALLGVATLALPPHHEAGPSLWLLLALVPTTLVVLGYGLSHPHEGWPAAAVPILTFTAIGFARDAGGGAAISGLETLVAVPLLWQALTGGPRDLVLGALCTIGVFGLPILLVGAPEYPVSDWRRAVLWVAFALVIAPRIQGMVQEIARGTLALAAEEARWRAIAENLPDTAIVVVDEDLRIRQVAGAASASRGLANRVGEALTDELGVDSQGPLRTLLQNALVGRHDSVELGGSDTVPELVAAATPLPAEADGERALVLLRDVTVERSRERALLAATERSERLIADAPHGVVVLDVAGRMTSVNKALLTMLGADPKDLIGREFAVLAPPQDGTLLTYLAEVMAVEEGQSISGDAVIRDSRGDELPVALSGLVLHEDNGTEPVVLLNVVDISERRRYENTLSYLADHDALTGLVNRRRFDTELQRHLAHGRRYGPSGALLLLDLDNFKQVNDTLGHNVGDQLIIATGDLLAKGLRSTDVVARLGGDEFAILLPEGDQAAAERVAQSIVARLRAYTASLDGTRRRVTASVGVVTFKAAQAQAADVLALADMTMYDAKEAGRNRYAVLQEGSSYPPRMGTNLEWQAKIEHALQADGFALLYQPIQDLHTGAISAAEVLVRLVDGGELVSPSQFLSVAERAGLMPQLDSWVMQRSIAQLECLREVRDGFQLHVNLSGHSIGHPSIEAVIAAALEKHRTAPGTLVLEVTETAAIADVRMAKAFAERMSGLGCLFALDDFGAGFGSFSYLKHLHFDYIKIDGEFVSAAPHSAIDRTIMRSVVGIARGLGKQTIAEFVSDEEILAAATAEGVDHAQGYLIGRPMPLEELIDVHLTPSVA